MTAEGNLPVDVEQAVRRMMAASESIPGLTRDRQELEKAIGELQAKLEQATARQTAAWADYEKAKAQLTGLLTK